MFGLGVQEILVLGLLGGGVLVVALVVGMANRGGGRSRALEDENQRLREETERLRGGR